MTPREMQIAFEMEANMKDPIAKPSSTEILYWLNRAIETFVKTRFTGNNPKGEGFEQSQKRIDDLRNLIVQSPLLPSGVGSKPNSYVVSLPAGYLYTVSEEVLIQYTRNGQTTTSRVGVTETSNDRYTEDVSNPFGEHILHDYNAKPLRLYRGTQVDFITDGNYQVIAYYLIYISAPNVIALPTPVCNLASHTHYEIVKLATKMYLESVKDPRLQTYNNEIVTME